MDGQGPHRDAHAWRANSEARASQIATVGEGATWPFFAALRRTARPPAEPGSVLDTGSRGGHREARVPMRYHPWCAGLMPVFCETDGVTVFAVIH